MQHNLYKNLLFGICSIAVMNLGASKASASATLLCNNQKYVILYAGISDKVAPTAWVWKNRDARARPQVESDSANGDLEFVGTFAAIKTGNIISTLSGVYICHK